MKQILMVFSVILAFLLSSYKDFDNVLYKNDKMIAYVEKGGFRINFLFENFQENEKYNVQYYFYLKPKKYIGSENLTTNKAIINRYIEKYKLNAFKDYFKVDFAKFEKEKSDFKIVYAINDNKMDFYYYHSEINGYHEVRKSGNLEKKKDSFCHYFGSDDFLVEIFSNNELLISKQFNLNK